MWKIKAAGLQLKPGAAQALVWEQKSCLEIPGFQLPLILRRNINVDKDKTMYYLSNQRGQRNYKTRMFYMKN